MHAAYERQKFHTQLKFEEGNQNIGGSRKTHHKSQSLRHSKLFFPVYKEGSDSMEWLRDCEEYFNIYEVGDSKRSAIAAMHFTGTPRSWYKSFIIGTDGASWQQFTEAFIARFVLDTGLGFENFKRLQQTKTKSVEDL